MKLFYLIRKTYSKLLIREFIIIILIIYMIYALTSAIAPLGYSLYLNNQIKNTMSSNTVYFQPYDRIQRMLYGFMQITEDEIQSISDEMEEFISNIDGVVGYGQTAEVSMSNDADTNNNSISFMLYNQDLRRNCVLPLEEGEWFTEENETDRVPIIIGGGLRDIFQVGDVIDIELDMINHNLTSCKIVGMLNSNDITLSLQSGATRPNLDAIAKVNNMAPESYYNSDGIIIAPLEKAELIQGIKSSGQLLFFDNNTSSLETKVELLNSSKKFGNFYTINSMYLNQMDEVFMLYNVEFILSLVLFLFGVFGLGGYTLLANLSNERTFGIYYICGMKRNKAIIITVLAACIIVIVPAILMTLLSPLYTRGAFQANTITFIVCLSATLAIMVVSICISIYRLTHSSYVRLLKGEQ